MTKLCFVDTETTGLDPVRHEVWEVGLIVRGDHAATDQEKRWLLPVSDLGAAEPRALAIGKFHVRHPQGHYSADDVEDVTMPDVFAAEFAKLTQGSHLVGAVVSFDEERLRRLLQANRACPEWHYHLVDVEALAAGRAGMEPPWESGDLTSAFGVNPDPESVHTALGDARWARDLYDAVMARKGGWTSGTGPVVEPAAAPVGSGWSPDEQPTGAGW